jgi:hypothetical protein
MQNNYAIVTDIRNLEGINTTARIVLSEKPLHTEILSTCLYAAYQNKQKYNSNFHDSNINVKNG